jgi:heat-inducible transcriptional repressor
MSDEEMLEREQAILEEIIQYYLRHNEAVSARTLAKVSHLALSPTTIRNLMEDLSAEGFLTTEGVPRGRIPTQKAFTVYVTRLGARPPGPAPEPELPLPKRDDPAPLADALAHLGPLLAERTGWVALAALPRRDRYALDWVRLHAVPRRQVLVTVLTLFGDLWSKQIPVATPLPDDLLAQAAHYINGQYHGASLERIRSEIMAGEPKPVLANMPSLGAAFRMLRRAFEWEEGPAHRVWGREHLLRLREGHDPRRQLQFQQVLGDPDLLPNSRAAGRPVEDGWVSIGTEIGYRGLEDCSIVGFPFGLGDWEGQLGVLGPMGMNYVQAVALAGEAAAALNGLLVRLREHALRAE